MNLEKMCTGSGVEKDEMYQFSTFLSRQCPSFVTSFPNDVVDVLVKACVVGYSIHVPLMRAAAWWPKRLVIINCCWCE